jgi:tRNA 2-thiouridine synthesizing protein A
LETKVIIDARGRSCPEPVIVTKNAVEKNQFSQFEVVVDNVVAKENVKRFCESRGFTVDVVELEGEYLLKSRK